MLIFTSVTVKNRSNLVCSVRYPKKRKLEDAQSRRISIVLISSLIISFYFLWRTTDSKKDQRRDSLKIGIPLLIPFFLLLFLLFSPQTVTQAIVPELEKKLKKIKT